MSEEEKKGRDRRNSEGRAAGGDQSWERDLKLASDHCGCGGHCFCFK